VHAHSPVITRRRRGDIHTAIFAFVYGTSCVTGHDSRTRGTRTRCRRRIVVVVVVVVVVDAIARAR